MNFIIFTDFFWIFSYFIFDLKLFLNKKEGFSRGSHVNATWHSRPRGNAMRAHAAPTRRDIYLHIYYIYYMMHKVRPSVYRKGIRTLLNAASYKRIRLF